MSLAGKRNRNLPHPLTPWDDSGQVAPTGNLFTGNFGYCRTELARGIVVRHLSKSC
jgi:hypothetical protein